MEQIKLIFKKSFEYIKNFIKWLLVALCVGVTGGIVGALFHICVDKASDFRAENSFIIYFLPLAGIVIALFYYLFRSKGKIDTDRIIKAAAGDGDVPFVVVPLIFVGTVITQMFGGSAGREGAALQIGGGIGYRFGKMFKLKDRDIRLITTAGMSSVFSALFGTPVAAAVFPIEMISVGALNFTALLPCIVSAVTARFISSLFGISPIAFDLSINYTLSADVMIKVILLSLCCAVLGIIFCTVMKKSERYMSEFIPNIFLRALVGGAVLVLLTLLVGTYDYNGTGMEVISRAVSGNARAWDFALKIIFTAITISAGYKGGEIIPTFFIGSTFGCVVASILGLDAGFGAAIGMISLFCSVVNCPLASIFLSIEMFGTGGILFFAVACAVSYKMSGYSGLYKSQKFVYSKLTSREIDGNNQQRNLNKTI